MGNLLHNDLALPVYKSKQYEGSYDFVETGVKKLMNMFWHFDSVNLAKDVNDYKALSDKEKSDLVNILRLFTQNEVQVSLGYTTLANVFKPTQVINWLIYANSTEVTHQMAYSLLTETLLPHDDIYTDFLDIDVMALKAKYIHSYRLKTAKEYSDMGLSDIEINKRTRSDIAKMLAIYGGGAELVSLYGQFSTLMAYQFTGKFQGLCTIVDYSIKDEYVHGIVNTQLFKKFVEENPDIYTDELIADIRKGIEGLVNYEIALLKYIQPKHINMSDHIEYIKFQADNALNYLGLKPMYNITKNPLPFMDEIVGTVLMDFFNGKVTNYSKQIGGSREELRKQLIQSREGG